MSPVCPTCVVGFGPSIPLEIPGVAVAVAGASHEGTARRIVLAGKSGGRTAVFRQMARSLTELNELRQWASSSDLVTWVPGAPMNVRTRGYAQGRVLGRAVANNLGLPVSGLFKRRASTAQTGLSRQQRQLGPQLMLVGAPPPRVLVVDDVITTGVSMRVAAVGLRQNGAELIAAASLTTRFGWQIS